MSFISNLFGGSARRDAQRAREQSAVDQTRSLASVNAESSRTALIRRNPRGRKLLADQQRSALPTTVA